MIDSVKGLSNVKKDDSYKAIFVKGLCTIVLSNTEEEFA